MNCEYPIFHTWKMDMGKLVVPNVYVDVDLVKDIAARYDPVSKNFRACNGAEVIKITKEGIAEAFKL